jgi:hypothetical protein
MTGAKVHHAVLCVRAENQERAADLWRDVGMSITLSATNLGE